LESLLAHGRQAHRNNLKLRLIAGGVKGSQCEVCGCQEWQGKPLALQLHHINGNGADNRLANLQLLCPNCHSQTDTWGARNRRLRPAASNGEVADIE
jgi:5-methylcytosine-specific restriction endonuclease McrA